MTTTFWPDISGHNPGLDLSGTDVLCAKATQGTSYVNPLYRDQISHAKRFGFAYHFLEGQHPAAQAEHCHNIIGKTGLMLDVEEVGAGNDPTLGDAVAFIDAYRFRGGICHLCYLPHWYWQHLGEPDLQPLRARNIYLVSSEYPSAGYSSDGPGWDAYGGSHPLVWQYTDRQRYHNQSIDFNAFKGTIDDLRSYVLTGQKGASMATGWHTWFTKGNTSLEEVGAAVGMAPASILRRTVEKFGPFDDVISGYVNDVMEGKKTHADKIPAGDGKKTGRLWVRGG